MIRPDISGRDDIEGLLRFFYGRVLVDDELAEPFREVRAKGLDAHLPVMCDFWETVLFRAKSYGGSALQVHQGVHDRHRLSTAHFLRWLTLWTAAVDATFEGPIADRAKVQAARIAWAMHRRIVGADAAELDGLLRAQHTTASRYLPYGAEAPQTPS
ncbi:group III truncated hemoglobin [Skermania sp. ID1734]|uniref:group III truncated hemoglobin n=1 Tax=Skermania sp. ID1734 TaxID=2597516 RepID=UPI002106EB4F|nr:group III truncated hemoglobin [Skermania sp. ID1734]